MSEAIEAGWLADRLRGRDSKGIAVETARLIRSGELALGARLPALRDLAFRLGVSPATLSTAWSELRRQKVIVGRGRNGTRIADTGVVKTPARTGRMGHYGPDALDLTMAVPDPALLPRLDGALQAAAGGATFNSYQRSRIEPRLEQAVRPGWPYAAEAMLATNGGYNAIYAAVHALVLPGDTVACEVPTAIRLLDILEDAGAHILPVECDTEGPRPGSLARALEARPVLFLYQSRTHSVTGRHVTPERLAALREVLARSETLILEDDGLGDLSVHPSRSLGPHFAERVIHVRSFSKSYGPDLRLAVLSAPEELVERIQSYRLFSAGWTSRLLQNAAAWLLTDADTQAGLGRARTTYATRRRALAEALDVHGVASPPGDGLSLWVPVAEESYALVTLAAHGIAVLPGEKSFLGASGFIRVGTSLLTSGYGRVAAAIALSAAAPR